MRMDDNITVAEAAAALRVSDETIQRACRTGALEHSRVGRAIRIPREAFEAYREGLRHRPGRVAVVKTYDAELSALVEAWLQDMKVGARPCSPDTLKRAGRPGEGTGLPGPPDASALDFSLVSSRPQKANSQACVPDGPSSRDRDSRVRSLTSRRG